MQAQATGTYRDCLRRRRLKSKYATPSGTITTLTSGTDAEVVKSATGVYYVDITTTQHGVYRTEWTGTGTVRAADGVEFTVDAPTVAL